MLVDASNLAAFIADPSNTGARRVSREEAAAYALKRFEQSSFAALEAAAYPQQFLCPEYYATFGFKDQDGSGACTGFAWSAAMQRRAQTQLVTILPLSGTDFYWSERGNDASWQDAGAAIGQGVSTGTIVGVCTDALWPDSATTISGSNVFVEPSAAAQADRYRHKILEAVYVGEGSDPGIIDRMCSIIASGGLLLVGIGNHCVPLFEYDLNGGWFRGPNSKGGPDPNNAGTIGIAFGIVGGLWNLYALSSVDYRALPSDQGDMIKWAAAFHTMAYERELRVNTIVSGWSTAMPTQAQIDAAIQANRNSITALNSEASALAQLTANPANPQPTTTTLAVSPNPATVGQTVTLSATVTGSNPTGSVTFKDGQTSLGTFALVGDSATAGTSTLTQGTHNITAAYAGDANNQGSSSLQIALTINAAGGGGDIVHNLGDPPIVKNGVQWMLVQSGGEARWGSAVDHNGRRDASAHQIVWDDSAGQIKLKQGDAAHPEIPYTWVAWTGSGYVATTAP